MSNIKNEVMLTAVRTPAEGMELLERLTAVTESGVVYSEPVNQGEYTAITASEVVIGMGFGFGGGGGFEAGRGEEEGQSSREGNSSGGGGGGGGGTSSARPVAVIAIGPDGVRVEPVVDVTKLGLAFFTTFGGMFLMFSRMRRVA